MIVTIARTTRPYPDSLEHTKHFSITCLYITNFHLSYLVRQFWLMFSIDILSERPNRVSNFVRYVGTIRRNQTHKGQPRPDKMSSLGSPLRGRAHTIERWPRGEEHSPQPGPTRPKGQTIAGTRGHNPHSLQSNRAEDGLPRTETVEVVAPPEIRRRATNA